MVIGDIISLPAFMRWFLPITRLPCLMRRWRCLVIMQLPCFMLWRWHLVIMRLPRIVRRQWRLAVVRLPCLVRRRWHRAVVRLPRLVRRHRLSIMRFLILIHLQHTSFHSPDASMIRRQLLSQSFPQRSVVSSAFHRRFLFSPLPRQLLLWGTAEPYVICET